MRKFLAALILALSLVTSDAVARQSDAQQRARELAALFSKSKHSVKEKRGVRVEKFLEVRGEPAVKTDVREYSGTYESDSDCAVSIKVGSDGVVEASGCEPSSERPRKFTLRGAQVSGAMLTGTKVYEDGSTGKFEGVFINRTERNSPNAAVVTTFGLGVVFDPPTVGDGFVMTRLFYRLK
ncbi:MAG: hypothetical protein H7Z38_14375 [Rubrivivax sp.]|nr:hypothetical protein [Pyrinomonadaceae bacterium]